MTQVNLLSVASEFCRKQGEYDIKAFGFGRLKLKTDQISWDPSHRFNNEESNARIIQMENNSYEDGKGQFSIEKENKPVFKFSLDRQSVVEELPYRVKFNGPNDSLSEFWAPVNTHESVIRDYTTLKTDTTVPLKGQRTSKADISHVTQNYSGRFECRAKFSGKILAIHQDERVTEIPVEHLTLRNPITLTGSITVYYQQTHNIQVS